MSSEQFSATPLPPSPEKRCPHCGAEIIWLEVNQCWLCHESLSPLVEEGQVAGRALMQTERNRLRESGADHPAWMVFGVLTLLVCLGLMLEAPGVLVVLLILATPALVRLVVVSIRATSQRQSPSALTMVGLFFSTLGIAAIVGLASAAAFFATCFVVCLGGSSLSELNRGGVPADWILVVSVCIGLVIALAVAALLVYWLWPRRR